MMEEQPPFPFVLATLWHPHVQTGLTFAQVVLHPHVSLQSHALLKEQELEKSLIYEPPK